MYHDLIRLRSNAKRSENAFCVNLIEVIAWKLQASTVSHLTSPEPTWQMQKIPICSMWFIFTKDAKYRGITRFQLLSCNFPITMVTLVCGERGRKGTWLQLQSADKTIFRENYERWGWGWRWGVVTVMAGTEWRDKRETRRHSAPVS